MRARLHTRNRELGFVELADGVTIPEVVSAMREHRLFFATLDDSAPAVHVEAESVQVGEDAAEEPAGGGGKRGRGSPKP